MFSPASNASFDADDWGLSPAVNDGIVGLAELGLLRTVSVMANLPYLELGLDRLLRTGVKIAAHLNFTLGRPAAAGGRTLENRSGAFHRFPAFVLRGTLGLVAAEDVQREAAAQLGRIRDLCTVASVNGHQHAHLLPWMIAPVAAAARAEGIRVFRRMDDPAHPASRLISRLAVRRLALTWPGAEWESTFYLWPSGSWSREAIARKLRSAEGRPLLVHPASRDDFSGIEFADGLREARVREFQSLRELQL